jgi:prepilin-type N-terminal cleavage/methylation domain-containing protein
MLKIKIENLKVIFFKGNIGEIMKNLLALKTKPGFTLAEVLITLAIIGVVAALTIPTVIRNYQERQTVSALKKFYSQISQAFKMAEFENGSIDTWDWGDHNGDASAAKNVLAIIKPYLKITQDCSEGGDCFAEKYTTMTGHNWSMGNNINSTAQYVRARLVDGMSFWIFARGSSCTSNLAVANSASKHLKEVCGHAGVDLNGNKKPNMLGKDTFYFHITKYGVIPMGIEDDGTWPLSLYCKYGGTGDNNGYACTAWVIAKENMDYLKKDVSW